MEKAKQIKIRKGKKRERPLRTVWLETVISASFRSKLKSPSVVNHQGTFAKTSRPAKKKQKANAEKANKAKHNFSLA